MAAFPFKVSYLVLFFAIVTMVTLWEKVHQSKKNKRKGRQLSPEDYYERDAARVAKFRINGKKYADATIKAINRVSQFWQR